MAYLVMLYIVTAYSHGLNSYGLHSHGLHSHGLVVDTTLTRAFGTVYAKHMSKKNMSVRMSSHLSGAAHRLARLELLHEHVLVLHLAHRCRQRDGHCTSTSLLGGPLSA